MKFAFSHSLRSTIPMVNRDFFSSKERDHRGQGEWKIGKRSTHLLKTQSANKRKESELIKDQNNREEVTLPGFGLRGGGGCTQARLWRFFFFALNFFLVNFISRYFLDFEWSTIIAEHFDQVIQAPVCLTWHVRLIGEKTGHRKRPILSYLRATFRKYHG